MKTLNIILGDCLYPNPQRLKKDEDDIFFMAETEGLCTHFNYHKQKIVFYLSNMRTYRDELQKEEEVIYHTLTSRDYIDLLEDVVEKREIDTIRTYAIEDDFFRKKLERFTDKHDMTLETVSNPGFLNDKDDFKSFLSDNSLFMKTYYEKKRRETEVLMDDGKPVGGKYSFDTENRKKLPKGYETPSLPDQKETDIVKKVKEVVREEFPDHPGHVDEFWLPTTRDESLAWLQDFLQHKLDDFGPYQDAFEEDKVFLNHSVLSPLLNIGRLTPKEVIDETLRYYEENDVRLSSVEGFIRQVMGWREFIRGTYHTKDLRKNFFDHQNKMKDAWYTGETGLKPLDDSIKKTQRYGYVHHIERLMVLSNIMLLSRIHPDEVYAWFMELFVDSTDWVMEPNVYGMGQYADGGTFATKPYICSSNYIQKMSHYGSGEWCDVLDGLYWMFIRDNKEFIKGNQRMRMMASMLERLGDDKKERIFKAATSFIEENTY